MSYTLCLTLPYILPVFLGQTANCVCVFVEHFLAGSGVPKTSHVTLFCSFVIIMVHVQWKKGGYFAVEGREGKEDMFDAES